MLAAIGETFEIPYQSTEAVAKDGEEEVGALPSTFTDEGSSLLSLRPPSPH